MLKKAFLVITLALSLSIIGHSQTIDIIITKSGKNLFGEILQNKVNEIEIKEQTTGEVRKVTKSDIAEVILGFKYEDLSESILHDLETGESEYDYIIRTNGDRLTVIILEVSDKRVLYKYPFESDDDKREIDRSLVEEIYQRSPVQIDGKKEVFNTYREEMDLEEKYMEEVIYTQNRMHMASFNFTAMGLGTLAFGYEKAFGKNQAVEVIASIHGAGVENSDINKVGFGLELGYKYKMGNIFSEYYLPDHLMSGTYIKPIIGFSSVNETIERYSFGNEFTYQNKNRDYGYIGFDLGYQWVFGDLISMDIYSGLAYYSGKFEITTNNNGELTVTNDSFFDEGDFFASDNFGAKAGFRIGILFGSKSKYQSK